MFHTRRFHPVFRAALALYLLSTLVLVAAHQHHDGLQSHDCALCSVAHTPTTVAAASIHLTPPASTADPLLVPAQAGWDSETHSSIRTRAPPLV